MVVPKARKLKSGNWFIQLRLGGESIPVTESTERKCEKVAQYKKAEYLAGKRPKRVGEEMTLREAIDQYIEARRNVLSPSTIRGYGVIKKNRFQKVIDKPIKDISDWQKVCNDEAKKVSAKTLKNAWLFVASVLRETTKQPVQKVTLPQVVQPDKEWLDPDQILLFINAIKGAECEIPALLALHSLRKSELCALSWKNIDIENEVIKVRGSAVLDDEGILVQKSTNKNKSSRRDVPIMIPRLIEAINENKSGEMVVSCHPNTVYEHINRICARNKLPEVGIHGLRHSFASLCYHLQVPEAVVQSLGGWSDYATVRKIYTHLAQKDILKSETALTHFFQKKDEKKKVSLEALKEIGITDEQADAILSMIQR